MKQKIKLLIKYLEYYKIKFLREIINTLNVLPIKNNRVLFHSFNGRQYSCNPRAISEYLMRNSNAEIYWAFNEPADFCKELPQSIKTVKMKSFKYYIIAKTSKCIIFNARGDGELAGRKNQVIIQTWHASNGYKKIKASTDLDKKKNKLACKDYTYVMCGTKQMEAERVRGTMCFNGPIIPGTPRMDAIINNNSNLIRDLVAKRLGIPQEHYIALYAPTYRSKKEGEYGMDYRATINALEGRFGGKWTLLIRLHYFVERSKEPIGGCIDATQYPDMQDLLIASDCLISDYSSCIWDYSFLYRPCFLFCPDLDTYKKSVDFNQPIDSWGFPISRCVNELVDSIANFDIDDFKGKMISHHTNMGSYEDGKASERVFNIINNAVYSE